MAGPRGNLGPTASKSITLLGLLAKKGILFGLLATMRILLDLLATMRILLGLLATMRILFGLFGVLATMRILFSLLGLLATMRILFSLLGLLAAMRILFSLLGLLATMRILFSLLGLLATKGILFDDTGLRGNLCFRCCFSSQPSALVPACSTVAQWRRRRRGSAAVRQCQRCGTAAVRRRGRRGSAALRHHGRCERATGAGGRVARATECAPSGGEARDGCVKKFDGVVAARQAVCKLANVIRQTPRLAPKPIRTGGEVVIRAAHLSSARHGTQENKTVYSYL